MSDVMIAVTGPLDDLAATRIVTRLQGMAGVDDASLGHRTRRLILCRYEPGRTTSRAILNTVESLGHGARLVGI